MFSSSDTILVTGGAGFIGSNVAQRLTERGARVVIVDRLGKTEKWRNLVGLSLHDIISPEMLDDYLSKFKDQISGIVHMGAISATTELDVDRLLNDNVRPTLKLRDWTRSHGVRLVYASSAATYGDGGLGFRDGIDLQYLKGLRPLNAYGWSKAVVDVRIVDELKSVQDEGSWAGLKFFNVYGMGEDHKGEMRSVINKLIPKILANETIDLFKSHKEGYEDGGQKRDFVYIDDCVSMIEWLLENQKVNGIFNVGSGEARTFYDLAKATFDSLGHQPRIRYVDMPEHLREKYQYFTEADMNLARSVGFSKKPTSLEEGVDAYVKLWTSKL